MGNIVSMTYNLEPVNDRRIIESYPMYYLTPIAHPTRKLNFHDLFYMIDGVWNVFLEGEQMTLKPGDIVFLPAGLHHYGDRLCSPKTRIIFFHFTKKPGDRPFYDGDKKTNENLLIPSHSHPESTRVFEYFQEIMKTWRSALSHRDLRCSLLINQLLLTLSDYFTQIGIKRDKTILDILDLFSDHPEKFFSIHELASQTNLSPRSLTLRFRAETGQSVHKYQLNNKLEQIAAFLQINSHNSLKNLALNFGFYDEYHLSAAFKKKYGLSPLHYTRQRPISGIF